MSVETEPTVTFGNPVQVPRAFTTAAPTTSRTFDVLPDGRIVGVSAAGQASTAASGPSAPVYVVLNWFDELNARVKGGR